MRGLELEEDKSFHFLWQLKQNACLHPELTTGFNALSWRQISHFTSSSVGAASIPTTLLRISLISIQYGLCAFQCNLWQFVSQ